MSRRGMPEYKSWLMARRRCLRPRAHNYKFYGGRGITFSQVFDDFKVFLAEMGLKPTPQHQLERINNSKGYEPGNVRWATKVEQCNNRRSNRFVTARGVTKTLAQWGRISGISQFTICRRLLHGWSDEDAVSKPVRFSPRWHTGRAKQAKAES